MADDSRRYSSSKTYGESKPYIDLTDTVPKTTQHRKVWCLDTRIRASVDLLDVGRADGLGKVGAK